MSYVTVSVSPNPCVVDVTGKKYCVNANCWCDQVTASWTVTVSWNVPSSYSRFPFPWDGRLEYSVGGNRGTKTFTVNSLTGSVSFTLSGSFNVYNVGQIYEAGWIRAYIKYPEGEFASDTASLWLKETGSPTYPTARVNVYVDSGQGSVSPSGTITVSWTGTTVTATPASGYKFDEWVGDIVGFSKTSNPVTLKAETYWLYRGCECLTTTFRLGARFAPISEYWVSIVVGDGSGTIEVYRSDGTLLASTTSSKSITVQEGTQIYFKATPSSGYELDRITVDGRTYYSSPTPTITVTGNVYATAYFKRSTVKVSLNVNPSGSGTLTFYSSDGRVIASTTTSTSVEVKMGTQGYFKVDPASGYQFKNITIWGTAYYENPTRTFTFDRDASVQANLSQVPVPPPPPPPTPKVNVYLCVKEGAGSISLYKSDGSRIVTTTTWQTVQVDKGMQGYFKADPAPGFYQFDRFVINDTIYTANPSPTFTFDRDYNALAYFKSVTVPPPPPPKVSISMAVNPAGAGTITLYRSDGVSLGSTTTSTTVQVDKGVAGYFTAQAATGYQLSKITVNGKEYYSSRTDTMTFDTNLTATAIFQTAPAPPPPIPPPTVPWWEQEFLGIPAWAWIALTGGVAGIGIAAYYLAKRK